MASEESKSKSAAEGAGIDPKSLDMPRTEVSATAVARMMGVATTTEIKLLEGKLDLIGSRISNMTVRLEKIMTQFNQLPTGSDLERIDVQIGSLKTMLRDYITGKPLNEKESAPAPKAKKEKAETKVVTADVATEESEEADPSEEGEEARS